MMACEKCVFNRGDHREDCPEKTFIDWIRKTVDAAAFCDPVMFAEIVTGILAARSQ